MNATATHDTKRGEDVRARINVLSEMPEAWERRVASWMQWNALKKRKVKGQPVPDPDMELLLYQTLVGAWPLIEEEMPLFNERLQSYLVKASREAKTFTSWLSPDQEYEEALLAFLEAILKNSSKNRFLRSFSRFQSQVAFYGAINSLIQVLLKIGSPGVPDFYQGTEVWDLSLVDPDNRRPVDFEKRRKLLEASTLRETKDRQSFISEMLTSWKDGRVKLFVTYKALNTRREHADLFLNGEYIPLEVHGQRQEHVCAFARCKEDSWALIAVSRLPSRMTKAGHWPVGQQVWGDDYILLPGDAPQRWLQIFTGEYLPPSPTGQRLSLSGVFHTLPVSLCVAR